MFKEDALLSSTVTPAELYFWNRSFFKHSVIRFNDFYLKAQSSALQQNTTIEQITFNNPTHSHKFTIIGTMKAILSVSTRSEASDFLSRMGFSEHKYPEIGMYLSAPSPHKKIDPSLSTFEVNSLQAASIWKLSYRIGLVPLFDVVAKLDEIHSFALDLSDLSIFWRVCYDICHVVSIFDLIYIHGLKKLKIMLQDLSFNCLMIHLDRCLHQDTLMTLLYDDIFSAASLALEREPLFMLPFYCTQILHNLTRCHPSAFGLHQQLLLQTLRMAINRGDLECDFSRVFRDQLNLEKLFVRDSRTGVMVLTLLQRSLQHKLLSGSHIVVELSALLKKFEYNSHYKSRIGKILSESHEDENSATEDTSSSAKPVKPHKDTLEDDFDFYFGDQKEEDVVRDLALLKKDTPHMDEEESSDDEMELNASDSDSDGKIAPRKERDGSPSSVAASESESEQLENKPLSKKEKKRKKKKKSKKAAKSTEDTSSDEEHDKKEKKKRKKKKAKKRKAVSDSDEEKEKKSSKKSNKKTSKKRKRTSDSDEEKSARKSKKRRKIKKD
uniref:Uncharacterized protein n=1 Tax=Percolomonas cosmopolitus TaxID=63605 RepID=A0A7S1KSI5_9EUKA